MRLIELWPCRRKPSSPTISRRTTALRTSSSVKCSSNRRMNGPMAHEALLSFALPSRSALRPSMSRRLTSLPSAAPRIRPARSQASTTSGSGLFQAESARTPTQSPQPTDDRDGAFVKTSASGPMATSRYCDRDAGRLDALKVDRRQQPRHGGSAFECRRERQLFERAEVLAGRQLAGPLLEKLCDRRCHARHVPHAAATHQNRSEALAREQAPEQPGAAPVGRKM